MLSRSAPLGDATDAVAGCLQVHVPLDSVLRLQTKIVGLQTTIVHLLHGLVILCTSVLVFQIASCLANRLSASRLRTNLARFSRTLPPSPPGPWGPPG